MRQERFWSLLTLTLLNICAIVAALTVHDVVAARPADPPDDTVVPADAVPVAAREATASLDADQLADQLDDYLDDSGIEDGFSAYVIDVDSGRAVYAHDEDTAAVPASTTKIVTAVTVLQSAGPDQRIPTRVVSGAEPDEIILVGGGDPTLTEERDPDDYPRLATLAELARDTAETLRAAGVEEVSLGYDDSLYPGPDTGPGWRPNYVTEGSTATVHALMHDGGRTDPDRRYSSRHDDPPLTTAEAFAEQLTAAGIEVRDDPTETEATASAAELAVVWSAPISSLVEIMMDESDNNVAEALTRQTALARGEEPSFTGGAAATEAVVAALGVEGVHVEDGSGLSVNNEITARALTELLLLAADPDHPDLHPTLSGLPVGHFTGTLADRYSAQSTAAAGAGVVRGKTGTLSGVSTLAGHINAADGQLLVFAFMANNPAASGSALDGLAAIVADCGC